MTDSVDEGAAQQNKRAAEEAIEPSDSKKMKQAEVEGQQGEAQQTENPEAPKLAAPAEEEEEELMAQPVEGQVVECNWQGGGKWFGAKVAKVYKGDLYAIDFDDGEKEFQVPAGRIRTADGHKVFISRTAFQAMKKVKEVGILSHLLFHLKRSSFHRALVLFSISRK
jgi:hypothetical protein